MTTMDETLALGMRVWERLRPALQARLSRNEILPKIDEEILTEKTSPNKAGIALHDPKDSTSENDHALITETPWPPTLDEILAQSGGLPLYSAILGVCDDGLPFLLDLTNPAPGSLLVIGDLGSGKTRLLRSFLASAVQLCPADRLAFNLIAKDLQEFQDLLQVEHCQYVFPTIEQECGELIEEIAAIAEERRRGRPQDPAILLIIDDLPSCVEHLEEQAFSQLYWLIRHGPRSRVWVVASLTPSRARQINPRLLEAFRTRLVGAISNPRQAAQFSGDENLDTRDLESGYQFLVPYGDEWLSFWVCDWMGEIAASDPDQELENDQDLSSGRTTDRDQAFDPKQDLRQNLDEDQNDAKHRLTGEKYWRNRL